MQTQPQQQNSTVGIFEQMLKSKVSLVVATVVFTVSIIQYIQGPQNQTETDLAKLQETVINLRDNHVHTIDESQKRIEAKVDELGQKIVRLETIISQQARQ